MHPESDKFQDANKMIVWLTDNNIKYLPRQLDHGPSATKFNYQQEQVVWFDKLYQEKRYNSTVDLPSIPVDDTLDLADTGRACCGGRQLCKDSNHKTRDFFVENKFPDWYCSVNHFFLFVKQVTGEIFINKDCKMNYSGSVGPIGNLINSESVLETLKLDLKSKSLPIVQCKKNRCNCGLCAPKAKNLDTYKSIMKKYQKDY
jgi:hypothetical protein